MSNVFTTQGYDGRNLGVSQPVGSSVTGSPLTTSGSSVALGPFTSGMIYVTTETATCHILFSKDPNAAATTSNMKLGGVLANETYTYQFAVDSGDYLHVIQGSGAGTVYVEQARTNL